jgi:hypothetical protein
MLAARKDRTMRPAIVALPFLALVSLAGCADNAELKRARAEADEAKAALAKVKAELDQLKTQRAAQQSEESKVMELGQEFIELLRTKRSDKAYQLTTASFQKEMFPQGLPDAAALRASDPLLNKYPTITDLEHIQHRQHQLKAPSDSKAYEFFCHAREALPRDLAAAEKAYIGARGDPNPDHVGGGPWMEFTLTIIQEDGAWKVDKVKVDMEVP